MTDQHRFRWWRRHASATWLRHLSIGLLVLLVYQIPLLAQDSSPPGSALNLEGADIKELVRWIAKLTGRNIIVHPDVKGQVTLIAGEALTPEDAYRVFLSVLQVHGLAVVETPTALKVVPAETVTQDGAVLDADGHTAHFGEDIVVRVLRIHNVDVNQIVGALKPFASPSALLAAYPDSNLLILSDRAANITRLLAVIARIDQADSLDVEVVGLRFASAPELYVTLQSLLPAAARGEGRGPTLAVDKRSNSLLLGGEQTARDPLRALIRRLDSPSEGEGNSHVIYLNYADAVSLVPILTNLASTTDRSDLDQTFMSVPTRIEAIVDRNALIITAPPSVVTTLKSVIGQLDTRRAQVVVEAIIVEVNNEGLSDFGVNWRSSVPQDGTFGAINLLPGSLPSITPPAAGGGLTLGFFNDGTLRGLLRALASDANANLLSTPTIVTLDNVEAEILVGENVPFITGASTGPASSTANPFQTIERHDIGVTLKVRPRVNNDNTILLNIQQTVESVTDSAAETADIVTSKRSITTQVLIEDDAILVLGGLIRDDLSQKANKVPLLGNIPLLGRAFRNTSNQATKKNLMVFIHPRILRTAADSALETHTRYRRLQSLQEHSNQATDRFLIPGAALPTLAPLPRAADTPPDAAADTAP